jgi:hypothetical protein
MVNNGGGQFLPLRRADRFGIAHLLGNSGRVVNGLGYGKPAQGGGGNGPRQATTANLIHANHQLVTVVQGRQLLRTKLLSRKDAVHPAESLFAKLGFLKNHMLTNPWVVFAEFQFVDQLTGVTFCNVIIARASCAEQFDQDDCGFCHDKAPSDSIYGRLL